MEESNFIINQKAYQYQWSGECFLSVKSFRNGTAQYQVKNRQYLVNASNFLILNDCTKYNLTIDGESETESLCIFFSPKFVAENASTMFASDEAMLDQSFNKISAFSVVERIHQNEGPIANLLHTIRHLPTNQISQLEQDEIYQRLFQAVFLLNNDALKEADRLELKRKTTREEIYRRVYYAKDFIDSNFTDNLSLDDISKVAMLSQNHLIRNFKQVFRVTPFQYITQRKIAEAKRLIESSEASITTIATDLGYNSFGNFSNYFKSVVGQSPMELREKAINGNQHNQ